VSLCYVVVGEDILIITNKIIIKPFWFWPRSLVGVASWFCFVASSYDDAEAVLRVNGDARLVEG
jgi:hypothetical protein